MKLEKPVNENYAATVVRLRNIIPLAGCDNIVGVNLLGFQAIIGKAAQEGDLGVVFPAETQLSVDFCRNNNLFRDKTQNADNTQAGYLEDNRRVRAVKLRKHNSSCLFLSLSSLAYTGIDVRELQEGDTFDKLGNHIICCKYVIAGGEKGPANMPKKASRVQSKLFPEHYETGNFFKNLRNLEVDNPYVVVTQKLHGTSIRVGNIPVCKKLSWIEKLARYFGAAIQDKEYAIVCGSRRVIKDANNPDRGGWYKEDIWTTQGKKLEGLIPENFIVYGELVGFTPEGKAIQHGYTYNLSDNQCELYVYRVAQINSRGLLTDLSWEQVKEFCNSRGLLYTPELWIGRVSSLDVRTWLNTSYHKFHAKAIPLCAHSPCDEGICIRVEGIAPSIYKAKSPAFLEHETKQLDKQIVDLETQETIT